MLRKIVFWLHLTCGVVAGIVVLIMSATGVILTYERQILAMEDQGYNAEPQLGQKMLSIESLVAAGTTDEFTPQSITLSADADAPAILRAGRSGSAYLNPYTAEVYPPKESSLDGFFSAVTGWHRWFNMTGENRNKARVVTGASNLMFLFLVFSGIYLWLPAVYRWSTMRLRLWFHPNAKSGQARDYNWHHVFGFWSALPLAVIVFSGSVFYYPWANNLVYQLAGEEPPQRGGPPGGQQDRAERPAPTPSGREMMSLDSLFAAARMQSEDWNTLTLTLPTSGADTANFAIDEGNGGQPQKRHSLSLNAYNGEVATWAPFSSQSNGRQARSWLRFLHTGEALGIIGQTVAGLVSFLSILMVWTGFALAWRRFMRWLSRQRRTAANQSSAGRNGIDSGAADSV